MVYGDCQLQNSEKYKQMLQRNYLGEQNGQQKIIPQIIPKDISYQKNDKTTFS